MEQVCQLIKVKVALTRPMQIWKSILCGYGKSCFCVGRGKLATLSLESMQNPWNLAPVSRGIRPPWVGRYAFDLEHHNTDARSI